MGDRTYYSVQFNRDPAKVSEGQLKELVRLIEFDTLDFAHVDRSEDKGGSYDYVHIQDSEYTVGNAADIAQRVLDWMNEDAPARLAPFSVQEDPYADWLGTLVSYAPETGFHTVECDGSGSAVIAQHQLEFMWKGNDPVAIAALLRDHFGPKSAFPTPLAIGRWPDRSDTDQMIDFNRWKTEVGSDETTLGFNDWMRNQGDDA